ncbi:hypothetical protein, partial [Staphylococcus epidermidis]|uniref:hypothetical protein n=1 Tax=Staphylococcus epidermidis TaxID=1282 RepID=UPI001C92C84E
IIEPSIVRSVIAHVKLPGTIKGNKGCVNMRRIIKKRISGDRIGDNKGVGGCGNGMLNLVC